MKKELIKVSPENLDRLGDFLYEIIQKDFAPVMDIILKQLKEPAL